MTLGNINWEFMYTLLVCILTCACFVVILIQCLLSITKRQTWTANTRDKNYDLLKWRLFVHGPYKCLSFRFFYLIWQTGFTENMSHVYFIKLCFFMLKTLIFLNLRSRLTLSIILNDKWLNTLKMTFTSTFNTFKVFLPLPHTE